MVHSPVGTSRRSGRRHNDKQKQKAKIMSRGEKIITIFISLLGITTMQLNLKHGMISFSVPFENIVKENFVPAKTSSSSSSLPKTLVIYFPQYHRDPLNDENWGDNFTDWDSLRQSPAKNKIQQPIPRPLMTNNVTDGLPPPLGYYNLEDIQPRQTQGILAKKYSIDGFIYHTYWFYDKSHSGPNLAKPLENMLKDGHPDLPFLFNWCAVKWLNVWMGKAIFQTIPTSTNRAITLQEQYFNATQDMIYEHYLWLKPFFEHQNYIRVNGEPAFLLYFYNPQALPILESLRAFAIADGFPGIHFIVGRSRRPRLKCWALGVELGKACDHEDIYDESHLNERQLGVKRRNRLDGLDLTKHPSKTRSILPELSSATTTGGQQSISSLLQVKLNLEQLPPKRNKEKVWDYNPLNQTMTYPYPLSSITHPFEVPAWCKAKNSTAAAINSKTLVPHHPEIIGVVTTFDNTPRRDFKNSHVWNGGKGKGAEAESPDEAIARFSKSYSTALYYQKCCLQQQKVIHQKKNSGFKLNAMEDDTRFVVINAMNEWAEGMSIEPSDVYGYRWLEAIKETQEIVQQQPCAN